MDIEFTCKNCDKIRRLSENEIEEIKKLITHNIIQPSQITDHLNSKDGKTCTQKSEYGNTIVYNEEHIYTLSEEFINQIIRESLKIKD